SACFGFMRFPVEWFAVTIAGDTAVLRQRCIMPDLAARRAKSKSAAVYAASVPSIKIRLRRHAQVTILVCDKSLCISTEESR
ncbi:TPA: hypothetical protein ACOWS5_005476, partial [Klebsiella pneumoniae]